MSPPLSSSGSAVWSLLLFPLGVFVGLCIFYAADFNILNHYTSSTSTADALSLSQRLHHLDKNITKTKNVTEHASAPVPYSGIDVVTSYMTHSAPLSSYQCSGPQVGRDAWQFRSCIYSSLCYSVRNRTFLYIQRDQDIAAGHVLPLLTVYVRSSGLPDATTSWPADFTPTITGSSYFSSAELEAGIPIVREPVVFWHPAAPFNFGHVIADDIMPIIYVLDRMGVQLDPMRTYLFLRRDPDAHNSPKGWFDITDMHKKFQHAMGSKFGQLIHEFAEQEFKNKTTVCFKQFLAGHGNLHDHGYEQNLGAYNNGGNVGQVNIAHGFGGTWRRIRAFLLARLNVAPHIEPHVHPSPSPSPSPSLHPSSHPSHPSLRSLPPPPPTTRAPRRPPPTTDSGVPIPSRVILFLDKPDAQHAAAMNFESPFDYKQYMTDKYAPLGWRVQSMLPVKHTLAEQAMAMYTTAVVVTNCGGGSLVSLFSGEGTVSVIVCGGSGQGRLDYATWEEFGWVTPLWVDWNENKEEQATAMKKALDTAVATVTTRFNYDTTTSKHRTTENKKKVAHANHTAQ